MPEFTTQDIIVVLAACVVAWLIGKSIKRKNERELREEMEAKSAQEAVNKDDVEIIDVESTEESDLSDEKQ